ncbi:MAG: class I SAM-dependent methyltransferase family protein [Methanosarcinales archaeon]|nr:class I SAM-dependent methyltransferase family protein [Methanosarcinales archaeon]
MKLWAIRVPRKLAEDTRRLLLQSDIIHPEARIRRDNEHILIPVNSKHDLDELAGINGTDENITIIESEFEIKPKKPFLEDILGFTPTFDVVGDIAIIDADDPDAARIASALMEFRHSLKVVLGAASPVEGEFRTRQFVVIAGEDRTHTVHKEYGCRYNVDLAGAYFSGRLGAERQRVAETVKTGQCVVDLFAGVGPFSILIGRTVPGASVVAIDKNPAAVELLRENILLNKVDNVQGREDDARDAAESLEHQADHVIMNLPQSAREFLDTGIRVAGDEGIVHFYDITHEDDLYLTSLELIQNAASRQGRWVECVGKRIVRSYAPYQYNVCIEFRVIDNDKANRQKN